MQTDWTMEFWIKIVDWSGSSVKLIWQNNGANSLIISRNALTEGLNIMPFRTSSILTCTTTKNEWYHISLINSFATNLFSRLLYTYSLNSAASTTTTLSVPFMLNQQLFIGGDNTGKYAIFHVKELRIWNIARSTNQIEQYRFK